jgi:hypothetical protein
MYNSAAHFGMFFDSFMGCNSANHQETIFLTPQMDLNNQFRSIGRLVFFFKKEESVSVIRVRVKTLSDTTDRECPASLTFQLIGQVDRCWAAPGRILCRVRVLSRQISVETENHSSCYKRSLM